MLAETALLCLALNIYHEARGETIPGQYAVALVTMNRAQDERQVCKTVFQPKQFSWANNGVTRVQGGWKLSDALKPRDADAWALAIRIASWTLAGRMSDFTWGATHYHTVKVKPVWSRGRERLAKIGNHLFFYIR